VKVKGESKWKLKAESSKLVTLCPSMNAGHPKQHGPVEHYLAHSGPRASGTVSMRGT